MRTQYSRNDECELRSESRSQASSSCHGREEHARSHRECSPLGEGGGGQQQQQQRVPAGAQAAGGPGAGGSIQQRILAKKGPSFQLGGETTWASAKQGDGGVSEGGSSSSRQQQVLRLEEMTPSRSYDDGEANLYDDPDELAAAAGRRYSQQDEGTLAGQQDEGAGGGWGEQIAGAVAGATVAGATVAGAAVADGSGRAAEEAQRRKALKRMKKGELVEAVQRLGLAEGKVDDMREALLPYVRDDGTIA